MANSLNDMLWIRRAILVLFAACVPWLAQAGSLADAAAALQRGDYATALRLFHALV